MFDNPAINFHGWSDPSSSFDRLAGILCENVRNRCCNFLSAKRKEEDLLNGPKRKQRRVGDSDDRQVTLSKAEVLKEFIPHQNLLIEVVFKRERMALLLVRNGERKTGKIAGDPFPKQSRFPILIINIQR